MSKDWKEIWPTRVSPSGQLKRGLSPLEKTEVYIYRAQQIHGNKYTYDKFFFTGAKDQTIVTCPLHGDFSTSTDSHINAGKGCAKCVGKNSTTEEFIKRALKIHGNRFDYSAAKFTLYESVLEIRCKVHGPFLQTPKTHLQGSGCPVCGGTKLKTLEQFIEDSKNVHGNTYGYSEYINAATKCPILCKEHGVFLQTPHDHLSGRGCPSCCSRDSTHVYLLQYSPDVYKIGITVDLLGQRLPQLEKAYGKSITVLKCTATKNPRSIEKDLLDKYTNKPTLDRKFEGYTELRILTEQEVAEICSFLETI